MKLSAMRAPKGSRKDRKRLGRGESSGRGKTAGRGNKGQGSRSGSKFGANFEGGQMPLFRRVPKFGFKSLNKKIFAIVNLKDLERFKDGSVVDLPALQAEGLIRASYRGAVKVLGKGEIKKPLTVKATAFSKSAMEAISKAGGNTEVLG
jgi:large subunit ribosomal protein L15